jgi:hypothetical protein
MNRASSIDLIVSSIRSMLEELTNKELEMVEDFIVNECDESYLDENGDAPNLFRMTILDNEDDSE